MGDPMLSSGLWAPREELPAFQWMPPAGRNLGDFWTQIHPQESQFQKPWPCFLSLNFVTWCRSPSSTPGLPCSTLKDFHLSRQRSRLPRGIKFCCPSVPLPLTTPGSQAIWTPEALQVSLALAGFMAQVSEVCSLFVHANLQKHQVVGSMVYWLSARPAWTNREA